MSTASVMLAAPSGLLSLAMFAVGLAVVGMLGGAFWLGARMKARESLRPLPEEQQQLPPGGAVHESLESREPYDVPRVPKGGHALTPYELTNMRTRPGSATTRPRWSKGTSGSFGGGGLGAH